MATLIQRVRLFDYGSLYSILENIKDTEPLIGDYEIDLMLTFKQLCEHLGVPEPPHGNMKYRAFWKTSPFSDFEVQLLLSDLRNTCAISSTVENLLSLRIILAILFSVQHEACMVLTS